MGLTTLNSVKVMLGVSSNDEDARYAALISAAERVVLNYVQRSLESETRTEYLSGNNSHRVVLRHTPVTDITSVHLDTTGYYGTAPDPFATTTELIEGVDYVLDWDTEGATESKSGILFRVGYVWPMGYFSLYSAQNRPRTLAADFAPPLGNIKVVYTAGFVEIPADIQYAVATLVAWMRRNIAYGGNALLKERIGDYAYELARRRFDNDFELGTLKATLAPYRNLGW